MFSPFYKILPPHRLEIKPVGLLTLNKDTNNSHQGLSEGSSGPDKT